MCTTWEEQNGAVPFTRERLLPAFYAAIERRQRQLELEASEKLERAYLEAQSRAISLALEVKRLADEALWSSNVKVLKKSIDLTKVDSKWLELTKGCLRTKYPTDKQKLVIVREACAQATISRWSIETWQSGIQQFNAVRRNTQ